MAQTMFGLVSLDNESADTVEAFWDEIKTFLPKQPEPVVKGAMTDEEAKAFEATQIEFGQNQGLDYGSVDIDYLAWIADKGIKLRRYMQSARAMRRQAD
jgi:hypothetical protein